MADLTKRVEAFIAKADKATKGPWHGHKDDCAQVWTDDYPVAFCDTAGEESEEGPTKAQANLNEDFIVASRNDAPGLMRELLAEREKMRNAAMKNEREIQQSLGKALGFPWFKDDPKNFPLATEADGVTTGEHCAATLAEEAARMLAVQQARIRELEEEAGTQREFYPHRTKERL